MSAGQSTQMRTSRVFFAISAAKETGPAARRCLSLLGLCQFKSKQHVQFVAARRAGLLCLCVCDLEALEAVLSLHVECGFLFCGQCSLSTYRPRIFQAPRCTSMELTRSKFLRMFGVIPARDSIETARFATSTHARSTVRDIKIDQIKGRVRSGVPLSSSVSNPC